MLFDGNDQAGLFCALYEQFGVNGFDGVDVNDSRIDPLACQYFSSFKGFLYHQTGGNERYVISVSDLNAFADLELEIFAVNSFNAESAETDINRSVVVDGCLNGAVRFDLVAGADNSHIRKGTHYGQVLYTLVRSAVLAYRKSGVSGADLNVKFRIADGVSDLLACALSGENSERACENDLTAGSQTGCHAHHIGFGDTHIEMSFRKNLLESIGFGGFGQVGVKDDYPFICTVLSQSVAVRFSCCYFSHYN